MSFESPLTKKRSLFSIGTSSAKKNSVTTNKKKLPPSGSLIRQRKLSLFKTPSLHSNSKYKVVQSNTRHSAAPTYQPPAFELDLKPKPLFQEDTSPTATSSTASSTVTNNTEKCAAQSTIISPKALSADESDLRDKLIELGRNTKRSELLLGQVKVLEEEGQKKDEKLRELNDKLHGIQRGLVQMDGNRTSLQQQVEKLEEEKHDIQKQLALREKEIMTLAKRCSSQEERMKESTQLRSKNTELVKEMEELRKAMSDRVKHGENLEDKERELQICREALAKVKKDHDALANTLQNCLANIKKLTQEKHEWCDERRRLLHRAELDLEKQRLQHTGDMNELKVNLQSRQDKIDQLENILKDKATTTTQLRKENIELNKYKAEVLDYEQKITGLTNDHQDRLLQLKKKYEETESNLSAMLEVKEEQVIQLETEVEFNMQKLMTAWSTVDVLQEESEELEAKLEALETKSEEFDTIEQERSALRDHCATMHQHLQDLTAEIINLQMNQDNLLEEKEALDQKLKQFDESATKIKSLESELVQTGEACESSEQALRVQMNDLEEKWRNAQEELADTQVRLDGTQEKLKSLNVKYTTLELANVKLNEQAEMLQARGDAEETLLQKEQMWQSREQDLQSRVESLDREKLEMETKLLESQNANRVLSQQLLSHKEQIHTQSEALQRAKHSETNVSERVQQLEDELHRSRKLCDRQKDNEDGLRTLITTLESDKSSLREQTNKSNELSEQLEKQLSGKDSEIMSMRSDLERAEQSLREKDGTIQSLTTELSCVRMSCHEEAEMFSDEIKELQQALASKEAGTSKLEKSLKTELHEANEMLRKSKGLVDNLKDTVDVLQVEKEEWSKQLQQLQSNVTSLTRKNALLQQSEKNIRAERDLLIRSENDAESETKRLMTALERELDLKESALRELKENKERVVELESELSSAQLRAKDQYDERNRFDSMLDERTDLLAQMVEHNKDIQARFDKQNQRVVDVENELVQLHVELNEREEALVNLRNETTRQQDQLVETLNSERNLREVAESELNMAVSQLDLVRQGSKDVSTLEKENEQLKNKVRRQEAFLKRKIQKEKVLRDRSSKSNLSTPSFRRRGSPSKAQSAIALRTRSRDASDVNDVENLSFVDEI